MVFGSFDGPQETYAAFLDEARTHGEYIIAVVAHDNLIEHLTGELPVFDFSERFAALKDQGRVHEVIVDNGEMGIGELIETKKPDIIALGSDQDMLKEAIEAELERLNEPIEVKVLQAFESNK